jgi:hypothetical protein
MRESTGGTARDFVRFVFMLLPVVLISLGSDWLVYLLQDELGLTFWVREAGYIIAGALVIGMSLVLWWTIDGRFFSQRTTTAVRHGGETS